MQKVKDDGMDSVAITDHGVMYGVPEFWTMANDFGIKPIIGCEIYVAPSEKTLRKDVNGIKYYHMILLAQNKIGYQNLNRIVSSAQLEGFYYKPRADKQTLKKYSEGIIATSACLAGPLSRHIIRGEEDLAIEWLKFLKDTYKSNFYLELQRNGFKNEDISDKKIKGLQTEYQQMIVSQILVNNKLKEYSKRFDIDLIATTDAHFLDKDDSKTQEILFAIKDGKQLNDPTRRLGYLDTYVKTQLEMKDNFQDLKIALENTLKVSEKIEKYDIRYDRVQPKYIDINNNHLPPKEELRAQVFEGAKERYGKVTEDLTKRINYELQVIDQKGYNDYFLVVSDIMKWAKSQGIVMGVRGSVAGSVVAYSLNIIHVEPIKWELYFERFLNPQRPSPPDIDMDIQHDRRDEIIEYVQKKYGMGNVAAICAIGRMKTKAAIRDVSRVMGIDLAVADKLSKMVHVLFGKVKKIDNMMEDDIEFAKIINSSAQLKTLKINVSKIEGMARHIGTHACGYLITPKPIVEYVSVQKEMKGGNKIITQNEGKWIEDLGLMKFDFLGLRNLTIIKNTLQFIKQYKNISLSLDDIPEDDKKTFDLFGKGETSGVFQFESPPMRKYLIKLQPETLEDLCFMVSAYRPGPMKYIPDYIDRKHGLQETTYLIPEMKPILKNTFGFAIYQEQVIKIAVDIAGYSMGDADLLRRAMGKKKMKIMAIEEPRFKKGVIAKGYNKKIADEIWKYLLPFADYGFNKAHGSGYALISYWCAYLKANFPIEYMAGLMHSDINDNERIVIDMEEAKRMGYDILPPNINNSKKFFSIEGTTGIRFGLGAIKNASDNALLAIVKEREKGDEYNCLDDIIERVGTSNLNKKTLECLIKVGSMDKFGTRYQLLDILPRVWDRSIKQEISTRSGQTNLFTTNIEETNNNHTPNTPLPTVVKETPQEKITWERELIGTYVTDHPLSPYKGILLTGNTLTIPTIKSMKEDTNVQILATIGEIKTFRTRKNNKEMAFVVIEDLYGKCDGVIFPNLFLSIKESLSIYKPILITGKVNYREDKLSLLIETIDEPEAIETKQQLSVDIRNVKDKKKILSLKNCIKSNPGNIELQILYGHMVNTKSIIKNVSPSKELIRLIEDLNRI